MSNPLVGYPLAVSLATCSGAPGTGEFPGLNAFLYGWPRLYARSDTASPPATLDFTLTTPAALTALLLAGTNATSVTVKGSNSVPYSPLAGDIVTLATGVAIGLHAHLERRVAWVALAGASLASYRLELTGGTPQTTVQAVAALGTLYEVPEAPYPIRWRRQREMVRVPSPSLGEDVAHIGRSMLEIPLAGPWYQGSNGAMIAFVRDLLGRRPTQAIAWYENRGDPTRAYLVHRPTTQVEVAEDRAMFDCQFALREFGDA